MAIRMKIKQKRMRKIGIGEPKISRVMYMRVPLRLGKDVFTLGKISAEREEKMQEMLKAFKHIMRLNDVVSYRACATSAMRDAENSEKVLKRLYKKTGIRVEIIKGQEEARLLSNNMVENSIRPLAIGRKNYLFCGDDDAAQRAAVVYSLLATCKAHGVNERAWLEDVLRRIPEYEQAGKDYADLLPGNWSALSAK